MTGHRLISQQVCSILSGHGRGQSPALCKLLFKLYFSKESRGEGSLVAKDRSDVRSFRHLVTRHRVNHPSVAEGPDGCEVEKVLAAGVDAAVRAEASSQVALGGDEQHGHPSILGRRQDLGQV